MNVSHGCSLGANCTIVCGNTIGKSALIAAGAVVTKNVKDYALMAGVPARQIGWVCECGKKLDESLKCECGRAYQKDRAEEIVVDNSQYIADLVDDNILPVPEEKCPPKIKGAEETLRKSCMENAHRMYES